MRIEPVFIVLVFGICFQTILAKLSIEKAHEIQIVSFLNGSFNLNVQQLNNIFQPNGVNKFEDHYVVIVSIVGAVAEGKSFLLNNIIRILQV